MYKSYTWYTWVIAGGLLHNWAKPAFEASQGFRVRETLKPNKWANKNTNKPKQEQKISGRDSLAEAIRKLKDVINSLEVEFSEHKMHDEIRIQVCTHIFLTALPPAVFLLLNKCCSCSDREKTHFRASLSCPDRRRECPFSVSFLKALNSS